MMYPYPYFRPPFFSSMYPKSSFTYRTTSKEASKLPPVKTISNTKQQQTQQEKISAEENRSLKDKPVFEIFGIKLYFDDLLLLGLLFFLYSEGVQDQELFFALVLLLLS